MEDAMQKKGKDFVFSEDELEAILMSGDAAGVISKLTGKKFRKIPQDRDIDELVDDILKGLKNPKKKARKRTPVPNTTRPVARGCGMMGSRC